MLNRGYWLADFVTISRTLRSAPAQYARALVHAEQDDGDLTHFYLHQTGVILRAIDDLHAYLARKATEERTVTTAAVDAAGFNPRQIALLEHALRSPNAQYTVESHRSSHRVSVETARQDLMQLEAAGLLVRGKAGRKFTWAPASDVKSRLVG